eukprot:TRINITY_DN26156_c0_g1_i1.p1 TRINITY_DN26156_c0_g1~~TRINITY_DN26156_c0_g1_i1.p1  ORF type:complete len:127 (-),score=46.34 TRINITY_DN26156_c0_g1_i1:65-445(-)
MSDFHSQLNDLWGHHSLLDEASSEENMNSDAFSFETCTDESFLEAVLGIIEPQFDGHTSVNIPSSSNTQIMEQIEDDSTSQNDVLETAAPRNDKVTMDAERHAGKDKDDETTDQRNSKMMKLDRPK